MKFNQLKIGDHFKFSKKTEVGHGIFNLVGVKKNEFTYRMGGINRIIETQDVRVVKTDKPLN
jgi:hypothetical protein